ncbi:MAG: hypothetical protein ACPGLV_04755 [Bacteroidia bacterium]
MNLLEQQALIDELYQKRLQGKEFTFLRSQLEKSGVDEYAIKNILAAVNEKELASLKIESNQINPNVFLALAIITLLSSLGLAYFIAKVTNNGSMQLLNAIPIAGAVILFYNYRVNKSRNSRRLKS